MIILLLCRVALSSSFLAAFSKMTSLTRFRFVHLLTSPALYSIPLFGILEVNFYLIPFSLSLNLQSA